MTDGPELNFRRLDIKLQVRDLQLRCEVIPVTAEKDFPTKDVFSAWVLCKKVNLVMGEFLRIHTSPWQHIAWLVNCRYLSAIDLRTKILAISFCSYVAMLFDFCENLA